MTRLRMYVSTKVRNERKLEDARSTGQSDGFSSMLLLIGSSDDEVLLLLLIVGRH